MRARPGVFRLERARERGDGLSVGALEQNALAPLELEQVAQVTGVEQNLLVRLPPLRCPERDAVETPGQALDDRKQLERAERLQQERVGPGFHALGLGALGAGEQDNRNPL